jgi:hypothetical protein
MRLGNPPVARVQINDFSGAVFGGHVQIGRKHNALTEFRVNVGRDAGSGVEVRRDLVGKKHLDRRVECGFLFEPLKNLSQRAITNAVSV